MDLVSAGVEPWTGVHQTESQAEVGAVGRGLRSQAAEMT